MIGGAAIYRGGTAALHLLNIINDILDIAEAGKNGATTGTG